MLSPNANGVLSGVGVGPTALRSNQDALRTDTSQNFLRPEKNEGNDEPLETQFTRAGTVIAFNDADWDVQKEGFTKEGEPFTSYENNKEESNIHCTIYHKSGDVHCRNAGKKRCGYFNKKCICDHNPSAAAYKSFTNDSIDPNVICITSTMTNKKRSREDNDELGNKRTKSV